jgi:acetylornithine deacetylase
VDRLLASGERNVALLLVVGEERNSVGAYHASKHPRGSKFLINGEPTENKLALGSKGALRFELVAHGRMAHSAYPHLGESAIEKLLDVLDRIRHMPLPTDPMFGPSTVNIGTIAGGRAPNVIPDHAQAEIFFRLVDDGTPIRGAMKQVTSPGDGKGGVEYNEVLCMPAMRFGTLKGFETSVVSYATDIPTFGGAWGEPFLMGPGSIHVAHTTEERVPKKELMEAVQIYQNMARELLRR